jgi:L-cysteine desulfidase
VRSLNVPELISSVCSMEPGAAEYTRHGINMNEHVAREGLHHAPGLAIGARLARSKGYGTHDPILAAQTLTAAAVDARMAGLPVPVMTSSGSGNQGIMVVLPSLAVARTLALDEQCLIRSVALGHVLLARFCEQLGPLTPLCGSALHAAAASSASVSHLLGGDAQQIEQAAVVVLGTQAGILCDGAKPSCALKAASGAQLAVRAALLSVGDLRVGPGNGLMDKGLAELIEDLVLLASAMDGASDLVLDILARDAL